MIRVRDKESEVRGEAWRRFRRAFPTGTLRQFERAWPALRDGILLERSRQRQDESAERLPKAA